MQFNPLSKSIQAYREFWFKKQSNPFKEDLSVPERFLTLLDKSKDPFSREEYPAHITGSCFVVNPQGTEILLMKHRKLGKWLQMGGHCDGDSDLERVALREAKEETGSKDIKLFKWPQLSSSFIPDLDIHEIPARKGEPTHFHFDIRYFGVCFSPEQLNRSEEECLDLAWFSWEKAFSIAQEESMHRQFDKFSYLLELSKNK